MISNTLVEVGQRLHEFSLSIFIGLIKLFTDFNLEGLKFFLEFDNSLVQGLIFFDEGSILFGLLFQFLLAILQVSIDLVVLIFQFFEFNFRQIFELFIF